LSNTIQNNSIKNKELTGVCSNIFMAVRSAWAPRILLVIASLFSMFIENYHAISEYKVNVKDFACKMV